MSQVKDPQKEQFWQAHIVGAKNFSGSASAYCRSQGIEFHNFKYWQRRLTDRGTKLKQGASSVFVPVAVTKSYDGTSDLRRTLPDPQWLAEVIFAIHARFK